MELKKQRNITKPLGMPVKYKDDEKREDLHTLIRISYNEKIRVIAFEQRKTKATVLDEILTQYFENKSINYKIDDLQKRLNDIINELSPLKDSNV